MQLLLLLILLSAQGGGYKELRPILEDIGGEDIKNAIGEVEAIAEILELAKSFIPSSSAPQKQTAAESFSSETERKSAEPEKISPFAEVLPFADPEIIAALNEYISGAAA